MSWRILNIVKMFVTHEQTIQTVTPVSSPKSAELVELLEHTFRSVNIGLVNEIAVMCNKLGVDI